MLADTANHAPVHKGAGRGIFQLQPQAAVLLDDLDIEILVGFQHFAAVIGGGAGIEYGQGAAAQQVMQTAAGGVPQAFHLMLAEHLKAAFRGHNRRYCLGHKGLFLANSG